MKAAAAIAIYAILALAFTYQPPAEPQPATIITQRASALAPADQDAYLAGINRQRSAAGKPTLTINSALTTSAQLKADHMAANNYWAHIAPDGTDPWHFFDQAGYTYRNAGENLARCFKTIDGTITGWINSPTHRENMLNGDFQETGFGSYQRPDGCTVIVNHFGAPN